MILFVRAENYRSIGKKQELNLIPTSDKSHMKNIIEYDREQALSVVPIYGGNATGKTNTIKIVKTLKEIITLDKGIESYYSPCKFLQEENIHLELIFFKEDIKYYYAIKYNAIKILEEKLYHYPKERIAKVFDREGDKVTYGNDFEKLLKKYAEDTPNSTSMLKFLATWLKDKNNTIDSVYDFFNNDIITFHLDEEVSIKDSIKAFKNTKDNEKIKEFINSFYKHLNIGATGIRIQEKISKDIAEKLKSTGQGVLSTEVVGEILANIDVDSLELLYNINDKIVPINIYEESKGIQ